MGKLIAIPESTDPRDFPDWLNPITVKELRQGLRQFHFPLVFLIAHAVLVAAFAMAFDSLRTGGEINPTAGSAISSAILGSFAFFGLLIQPLRALFTISEETSTHSMDFLLLTRLEPMEIFHGKWLALFSQTVLLAVSLLPYLVLRYHLGGMRLFGELSTLYWMLIASGIMTAIAVTSSVAKSKLSRFTLPFMGYFVLFSISGALAGSSEMEAALQGNATAPGYLSALLALNVIGITTIRLILHAGAAQIASAHNMGSERLRWQGLILLVSLLVLPGWTTSSRLMAASIFAFVLLAATFVEPPVSGHGPARETTGRHWVIWLNNRFFLPGWPHGALYAILILLPIYTVTTLLGLNVIPTHGITSATALAAALLPLLPFLPICIVAMLDLGDKDVLSRATNPFLLGVCLIPALIIMTVVGTTKEYLFIPLGFLYFLACLVLGSAGWEFRHRLRTLRSGGGQAPANLNP